MTAAQPQADFRLDKIRTAKWLLASAIVASIGAAGVFYALPGLDISVSSFFYRGQTHFVGMNDQLDFVRDALFAVFTAVCIVALVGLAITAFTRATWLSFGASAWLYLVLCLGLGPGLIGNFALKNHWGRARPTRIIEFGGAKDYSLPLTPSDQCSYNCSFVAGEASTLFIVFFAAAFLFPRRSRELILAGVIFGSLAGLMRIAQGAHFLSDVVFAGVIMAVTAAALDIVFQSLQARLANQSVAGIRNPLS